MKILVIPEDFRKDQYMLKPIIAAMIAKLGKPHTKIRICQDPLLGGVSEALKWENIQDIINQYPMVDLFLLCVDRDGKEGRKTSLQFLETQATNLLPPRRLLLAENAWQEIEVWVLAGQILPSDWNWQNIRNEINPKETYFLPLSQQRNLLNDPGEGRKTLAEEAARKYDRIRQLCPEDIVNLETRINAYITGYKDDKKTKS
ncbi:hypothetical protein NIES2119_28640 [[Phormidium ambiguum] IAM M-71]|uniref:DUF4276 family protein n=1 Tax=[Phormidium ambiguum] IAM M-71 TaxID=454136 RepID=A0A1U7I5F4_9CYAN|nr:hypothetical protein [Phormidium ambiguum]OKH31446.1 hypothetical protein NIES2119_28640 [Phormidium ambiguum IAM M-71]